MLSKSSHSFTPSPYGSLAGLRRTEHCAPLTRHGLAFSQPSKDLATPPAWGRVQTTLSSVSIAFSFGF